MNRIRQQSAKSIITIKPLAWMLKESDSVTCTSAQDINQ